MHKIESSNNELPTRFIINLFSIVVVPHLLIFCFSSYSLLRNFFHVSQNHGTIALASRCQRNFWSPEISTLAPEVELEHSDPRVSGAGYQLLLENLVQAEQEWAGQAQLQHRLQPWSGWLS